MSTTYAHTPCIGGPGDQCGNPKHDHYGAKGEAENGGLPIPDSDQLHCAHCGVPCHYDYGDERYHHDNPRATPCFLIPWDDTEAPLGEICWFCLRRDRVCP